MKVIGLLLETKKILDSKKNTSHISRGCWQKLVLKVLKNSQKNVLSSVPFNQFDLPNLPPIIVLKLTPLLKFLVSVTRIFEIVG